MGSFQQMYRDAMRELTKVLRERSNYRAVLEGAEYQNIDLIGKETRDCRQIGERAVEITQGIIDERNELRVEVDQQAKIIGKSIDDSDKWAMEKRGMEVDLDRMKAQLEAVRAIVEATPRWRRVSVPEENAMIEMARQIMGILAQPDSGKDGG